MLHAAFTIRVPATSANLGSGFDCLGVAIDLCNTVRVEPAARLQVEITGEGEGLLPRDESNRVVCAIQRACAEIGRPLPSMRLRMRNRIPLGRGLGSSAAAAVAGLLAANVLYDQPLNTAQLLTLATELEGHPDNVAPALLGGLCVVATEGGAPVAVKVPWPAALRFVLFVPDTPLPTDRARAVLPASVPRTDAVFNAGRAALWLAAITQQRYDLLATAAQDRLHQPYRSTLVPGFKEIVAAALAAGAWAAYLSGAGSSIAAVADSAFDAIADAMLQSAHAAGQSGRIVQLGCDQHGARLEPGEDAMSSKDVDC